MPPVICARRLGIRLATLLIGGGGCLASLVAQGQPVDPAPAATPAAAELPSADLPATATPTARRLPPVVVTGRRDEQPLFEADRTLHRLDRDRLAELQAQGTPEALLETAGVHLQQTNRGAGAPYLRGLVGPQNLILVDGIRFNNATFRTGPNQYLSMLDPSAAERIEVLLGPGSVLYGSDAMGGVVQVLPVDWWRDGFGGRAGVRLASADTAAGLWAQGAWRNDRGGVLIGGAVRDFGELSTGDGGLAPVSDYQQYAWHARGRYVLGERTTLDLVYLAGRIADAGRADQLTKGRLRFYDNDDDLAYLDLRFEPGGLLREIRVAPSVHRLREVGAQFRCPLDATSNATILAGTTECIDAVRRVRHLGNDFTPESPVQRQDETLDEVWTPGVLLTAHLGRSGDWLRGTVGAEAYRDTVSSTKEERRGDKDPKWAWQAANRGNYSEDSSYLSVGAFAHGDVDVLRAGRDRVVLAAGARVSSFSAEADAVPGVGDVAYDFTGAVATAGLRWLHGDTWMVYASFAQGFRAPNLQETTVLGDTGSKFEVPNANLRPEESNGLELGARVEVKWLRLHVAGFSAWLDDVIDERKVEKEAELTGFGIEPGDLGCTAFGDDKCKTVVQRVNTSTGHFVGAEATLEIGPVAGLVPWLHASWIRGDLTDAEGQDKPARRVPPPMGSAGLRWQPGDAWYVEAFSRFAARQDRLHPSDEGDLRTCENPAALGTVYADGQCPGTAPWATANLRGGYRFDRSLRVDAALTNLLDEKYRYHGSGFDAPGLGVTVSLAGEY